jgi:phenylalanyl-tRNA synthetase beta chain
VLANFDIKIRACAFELDMDALQELSQPRIMRDQIARYPAVERDLAIIVKDSIMACDVLQLINESGGDLLQNLVLFDVYAGGQIPAGSKSLAFRLTFQAADRTLTEAEVSAHMDQILADLKDRLQASLR